MCEPGKHIVISCEQEISDTGTLDPFLDKTPYLVEQCFPQNCSQFVRIVCVHRRERNVCSRYNSPRMGRFHDQRKSHRHRFRYQVFSASEIRRKQRLRHREPQLHRQPERFSLSVRASYRSCSENGIRTLSGRDFRLSRISLKFTWVIGNRTVLTYRPTVSYTARRNAGGLNPAGDTRKSPGNTRMKRPGTSPSRSLR